MILITMIIIRMPEGGDRQTGEKRERSTLRR